MTPERITELRLLAKPSTNARWLAKLLNEALDEIETLLAASREALYVTVGVDLGAEPSFGMGTTTTAVTGVVEKIGPEETAPVKRSAKEKK